MLFLKITQSQKKNWNVDQIEKENIEYYPFVAIKTANKNRNIIFNKF